MSAPAPSPQRCCDFCESPHGEVLFVNRARSAAVCATCVSGLMALLRQHQATPWAASLHGATQH